MKHVALIIDSDSGRKKMTSEAIRLLRHKYLLAETMLEGLDFLRNETILIPTYIICEQELLAKPGSKLKNSKNCILFIEQAGEISPAPIIIQSPPGSLQPEDCSKLINHGAWKVINEISENNQTMLLRTIREMTAHYERAKKYLPFKGASFDLHPNKLVINNRVFKRFPKDSIFGKLMDETFPKDQDDGIKRKILPYLFSKKYHIREKRLRTTVVRFRKDCPEFFKKEFNTQVDGKKMFPNDNGYCFGENIRLRRIAQKSDHKDFASFITSQYITQCQREIINLFSNKKRMTQSAIVEKMKEKNYPPSTVRRNLTILRKKDILRFQGAGLRGYWETAQRDRDY